MYNVHTYIKSMYIFFWQIYLSDEIYFLEKENRKKEG